MADSTEKLKIWCDLNEFSEISQYIHQCNKELHIIFEDIKSKKLSRLLPQKNSSSENKLVVTIPSDLPLDNFEPSVLGKGLGVVPTNRKPEKFQCPEDLSKFYRKIRLHLSSIIWTKLLMTDSRLDILMMMTFAVFRKVNFLLLNDKVSSKQSTDLLENAGKTFQ